MGNGLTFFFIFLCMAFVAGFALRWFVLLFAGGGAAIAGLGGSGPDAGLYDQTVSGSCLTTPMIPLDAGWQQTRSLLALGSGGLFGQGYMQGTQTQSG